MNSKELLDFGINFELRRIYLTAIMDSDLLERTVKSIHVMSQSDGKIEIWINSPGGELESTFGVYDVIQQLDPKRTPLHTIVFGEAASAAFLILASGHKRFATESSWGMAHHASGGAGGSTDEVLASAEAMQAMERWMWHLLSRHTKKTATQWLSQARTGGEIWMSAPQLITCGVVDEILMPHPTRKFRKSSFINGKKKASVKRKKREPKPPADQFLVPTSTPTEKK